MSLCFGMLNGSLMESSPAACCPVALLPQLSHQEAAQPFALPKDSLAVQVVDQS